MGARPGRDEGWPEGGERALTAASLPPPMLAKACRGTWPWAEKQAWSRDMGSEAGHILCSASHPGKGRATAERGPGLQRWHALESRTPVLCGDRRGSSGLAGRRKFRDFWSSLGTQVQETPPWLCVMWGPSDSHALLQGLAGPPTPLVVYTSLPPAPPSSLLLSFLLLGLISWV